MKFPSAPTWQPLKLPKASDGHQENHQWPAPVRPAALPHKHRRGMLALGVALVGLGILAGGMLLTSVTHRTPVISIAANIPVGSVITGHDLTTSMVSVGSGIKTIPASQLGQVTGLVAATSLKAGTLLAPGEVTSSLPPTAGNDLVTLALKPSQIPASGLNPGDQVLVLATPGTQGGTPALAQDIPATVIAMAGPTQDGYMTVDVQVPAADGPAIAKQDSTGQIAIIVTARGS